jgi:thiol-disulfide isomerase/thioredoxin
MSERTASSSPVRIRLGGGVRAGIAVVAFAGALAAACAKGPEAGRTPARVGDGRESQIVPVSAVQVREVVAAARGDVVLLNVWATWCNPCREEFPHLVRLQRELASQGFSLVLVSADFDSQLPKVSEFLDGHGVDFRTYRKVGSDAEFIDGIDPRWSGALPATFLYDRGGTLRDFWEGELSYEGFLERLRPWLDAGARMGGIVKKNAVPGTGVVAASRRGDRAVAGRSPRWRP